MNEANLQIVKDRWDTERNKLTLKYPLNKLNIYNYYSDLDGLEGVEFFNTLKDIITITQVTYGEARFVLELSDAKHSVYGSYLHGIYDSKKLVRYWDNLVEGVTATIDREHVWPQSYLTASADNSKRNIASDVHNLRAILKSTNNSRNNHYFVSGSGVNDNMGNGTYYPGDDHRGDVARILFYMHVRYNEELYLTNDHNVIKNKNLDPLGRIPFGLLNVLLDWHEADPVDEFERHRNDIIYMYQGNRNPFIDNPGYVDIIFAETTEGETVVLAFMNIDYDINLEDFERKNEEEYLN